MPTRPHSPAPGPAVSTRSSGPQPADPELHAELRTEIARARTLPLSEPWVPSHRNVGSLLERQTRAHPDRLYLAFHAADGEQIRTLTYGELGDQVSQTRTWLRSLGVTPGARVAVLAGNLDYVILVYLGAWSLGACVVPVNASESEERKAFILQDAHAGWLLAESEHLKEAERLTQRLGLVLVHLCEPGTPSRSAELPRFPQDLSNEPSTDALDPGLDAADCEALLVYTSGTTGPPKGVLLDQHNLLADADAIVSWQGWSPATRALCVLPIHHVNGIVVSHLSLLYAGGSVVLCRRFRSQTFWGLVRSQNITTTSLVPTLLEFLLDTKAERAPEAAATLSSVLCGAGPLRVDTALRFEERFGIPLIHGYGLSETTGYNCQLPLDLSDNERLTWLRDYGFPSIGCALPHHELQIQSPDGTPMAAEERGEICIRGEVVSRGYLARDDANRTSFRNGWFRSGDEGFFVDAADGRRFFFITGRIKELIIRGGVNYSPLEIDEVLSSHPGVHFALAIPFENRYYGEEVAAYVVPEEGAELDREVLEHWCSERLDFARCPKVIFFGDEVPFTTTGKPRRIELAARLKTRLDAYRDTQFRERTLRAGHPQD